MPRAALAAAVLLVAGGAGRMAWEHWQSRPLFVQDYATGRGQQLNVELPDGSRLRLDTATRVHVALYRQRREVRLPEGQAVFQVHGDADRPFDVLAGSVKVTVVGTQFAVRHTAGSPVQVAVQEGQVRVSAAGPSDAVLLTAGQQVQADGDGRLSAVGAVPPAGIAPWRDGRVSFDNVPLSQALAEFERYGPTRLAVRDPAVAAMRLSGTFDPRRLDNFRKALPRCCPCACSTPRVGKARRPSSPRPETGAASSSKFFTGGLGFCRAVRLPEKDSYSQPSGDFPHAPFQFHFHSRLHSRFRPLHPVPLALATALLLATMAAPSRAQSQAPLQALPGAGGASAMASVPVQIRIASQPLAQALDTLARQARLELMVQPALVEGRTAPAVEGRLSASGHGPPAGRHRPVCGNRRQRRHRAAHAPGAATGSLTLAPVNVSARQSAAPSPRAPNPWPRAPSASPRATRRSRTYRNLSACSRAASWTTRASPTCAWPPTTSPGPWASGRGAGHGAFGPGLPDRRLAVRRRRHPRNNYALGNWGTEGMVFYDRLEVLRGASGLLQGTGSPGGAVNLVRKRGQAERTVAITARAGSWDRYGLQLDAGGPLNSEGTLRGRVVLDESRSHSFVDYVNDRTRSLYAALDYDISPDTTVGLGISHSDSNGRPMIRACRALPMDATSACRAPPSSAPGGTGPA